MVLESLMLLLALATPPKAPRLRLAPAPLLALAAPAAYQPHERAVGNWRFESALGLDLPPLGAVLSNVMVTVSLVVVPALLVALTPVRLLDTLAVPRV